MNTIGKKNILFGFVYFLATLAIGMYLAVNQSDNHALMKMAHSHGNLEALLNIVCGVLICMFGTSSGKLAKVASILFIVAALFHSGNFYLRAMGWFPGLRIGGIGAISLVVAMAMMIPIIAKGLTSREKTTDQQ